MISGTMQLTRLDGVLARLGVESGSFVREVDSPAGEIDSADREDGSCSVVISGGECGPASRPVATRSSIVRVAVADCANGGCGDVLRWRTVEGVGVSCAPDSFHFVPSTL